MAGRNKVAAKLKVPLAGVAALALVAGALALRETPAPHVPGEKIALRVGDQADHGQTLAYYPEHLAALASIRSFQPAEAWRKPEPPKALAAARPAVHPPPRPAALKSAPDTAPPRAEAPALALKRRPAALAGIELPGFVPTGDDIRKGVSGVGDGIGAAGDRLVDMGRSLGRMMRLSSR